ncbi:MAG: winged helix-turn-helix domain-containing protein [Lysobacteraceae bacterium]
MRSPYTAHMRYLFNGFELDTEQGRLIGPEGPVNLRPKAYALLLFLIQRAPALTAQDDIIDAVWGHSALSRNVLPQTIRDLRIALGDSAQPSRFIETRHRRGYRWIAETQQHDGSAEPVAEPAPSNPPPVVHATAEAAVAQRYPRVRWSGAAIVLLMLAALWLGLHDRFGPARGGAPPLQWVWLSEGDPSAPAQDMLPLVEHVLRWETDLRSDDQDPALPLLRLQVHGANLFWRLYRTPSESASTEGELRPAHCWQDLDQLLTAVQAISDRQEVGLDARWPTQAAARRLWRSALAAEADERFDDAKQAWQSLLHDDPGNPLLRVSLRQLLMRQGDWSGLAALAPEGPLRSALDERAAAFERFLVLIQQGAPIGPDDPLAQWLRREPSDSEAALLRVSTALTRGEHRLVHALLNELSPELLRQPAALFAQWRVDATDASAQATLRAALAAQIARMPPLAAQHWRLLLADELRRQGALDTLREWLDPLPDTRLDTRLLRLRSVALGVEQNEPIGGYPELIAQAQAQGAWRIMHQASYEYSLMLSRRGDPKAARAVLDQALPLAIQQADPRSLSELQLALGAQLALLGDADGSQDALQAALAQAELSADRVRIASVLTSLGMRLALQSRYDEAEARILHARQLFADSGDRRGELVNLTNLGGIESRRGRLARARELYREAVAIAEDVADRAELGRAQYNQAIIEQRLDDHATALHLILQANTHFMHAQAYVWASRATVQAAELLLAAGDLARARSELERLQPYRSRLASHDDARIALAWARWYEVRGDHAAAEAQLLAAEKGFASAGQQDWVHLVRVRQARSMARQPAQRAEALARVRLVRREWQRSGQQDRRDLVRAGLTEVELLIASADLQGARQALRDLDADLTDLQAPELTLQADMLDAALNNDTLHLRMLAASAEQRGYALAAQWARLRSGERGPLPADVDANSLAAQPSSAF